MAGEHQPDQRKTNQYHHCDCDGSGKDRSLRVQACALVQRNDRNGPERDKGGDIPRDGRGRGRFPVYDGIGCGPADDAPYLRPKRIKETE